MPTQNDLLERRVISPSKLQKARVDAGFSSKSALARKAGIKRLAYQKWEDPQRRTPLTRVDFVAFTNLLKVLAVEYEAVTDPLPGES